MKKRGILIKVVSPTGCVHFVKGGSKGAYRTACNHVDYNKFHGEGYYHDWEFTLKPVTCKRCLKSLEPAEGQKTETKLKHFTVKAGKNKADQMMSRLNEDGCTVDDIISITSYHSGPYNDYTVWYKKGAK